MRYAPGNKHKGSGRCNEVIAPDNECELSLEDVKGLFHVRVNMNGRTLPNRLHHFVEAIRVTRVGGIRLSVLNIADGVS